MMKALSFYISNHFIKTLLFDVDKLKILDEVFIKIPYQANVFEENISKSKFEMLTNQIFEKFGIDPEDPDTEIVITSNIDLVDFEIHANINDVVENVGIPFYYIDYHYDVDLLNILDYDANSFYNFEKYRLPLTPEVRAEVDSILFKKKLEQQKVDYDNVNQFLITTLPLNNDDKNKYIETFLMRVDKLINVCSINLFVFDFKLEMIPLLSLLQTLNIDVEEYFDQNSLKNTAKLITLQDVNKFRINDSSGLEMNLNLSGFNHVEATQDQNLNVMWNARNSKFDGKISGTETGVYFSFVRKT